MATAKEVIKIAEAEVGYLEKKTNSNLDSKTGNAGYNNYTKYANDIDKNYPDFYNGKKNGYSWCDVFVDWCFIKAFGVVMALLLLCQPKKSMGAGCTYSVQYYKKAKRFFTSPKFGDQIFFKGSDGKPCHTGLVYMVDSKKVYTIEGNTSNASGVVANGGGVAKKSYPLSYSKIYGYGRPRYDEEPTKVDPKKEDTPKIVENANLFDSAYRHGKSYRVSAINGLNIRKGAGTDKAKIGVLTNGTKVTWYGYYTKVNGVKWLYVLIGDGALKGSTGYVSSEYLK